MSDSIKHFISGSGFLLSYVNSSISCHRCCKQCSAFYPAKKRSKHKVVKWKTCDNQFRIITWPLHLHLMYFARTGYTLCSESQILTQNVTLRTLCKVSVNCVHNTPPRVKKPTARVEVTKYFLKYSNLWGELRIFSHSFLPFITGCPDLYLCLLFSRSSAKYSLNPQICLRLVTPVTRAAITRGCHRSPLTSRQGWDIVTDDYIGPNPGYCP